MIDLFASAPHYAAHLLPIFERLTAVGLSDRSYGSRSWHHGATAQLPRPASLRGVQAVMVASYVDYDASYPAPVVYVEHGCGQCLTPETRALGADLRWTPVGDLSIGDELVAFEEERSDRRWRQWRRSWVTATRVISEPCYRLLLSDGSKVTTSAAHLWLTRTNETYGWLSTEQLQPRSVYPSHASKLVKVFEPWEEDRTWGAGYLAAAFDGEGCLTQTPRVGRRNRGMLTFTQRDNAMLLEVEHELTMRGFAFARSKPRSDGVLNLWVLGGTREVLRFLGSIRPRRLLAGFKPYHGGQMRGQPIEVIESEYVGSQQVVALQTTTGTLIAEGFATHNSYDGTPESAGNPSYSGGPGFERVVLFVCPSERVAERWRAAYPDTPAVAVGSPKMDRWCGTLGASGDAPRPVPGLTPCDRRSQSRSVAPNVGGRGGSPDVSRETSVALTFHWDCPLCPETLSAWRHYDHELGRLAEWARFEGIELLGHGHPRLWRKIAERWRRLGVEPVAEFDDVLARADLLVADNTSAMFEFASTGRPVVVLNAPWYRREVEHGGRFWEWADVGVQVDEPRALRDAITLALSDPAEVRANRERIVGDVYAHRDGKAAQRAADAIAEVLSADTVRGERGRYAGRGF